MITLRTRAGLANRMRAIDSAYLVSVKKHHELKVIWEMSWELNCSFYNLFKPVDLFTLDEFSISRYPRKFRNFIYKAADQIGIMLPLNYSRHVLDRHIEKAKEEYAILSLFPENRKIFLSTVHQFMKSDDSFSYFKPIDSLQERIDKVKDSYSSNTVGIHIRRTDNATSIRMSPREAFVELMQKEIENDQGTNFFLATDSEEEEKYIKDLFPGKILTYQKELSRNTEKGIQDALIDLYCLSNTKKIIGSFYSSFSEVAAQINTIPLELINIQTNQ